MLRKIIPVLPILLLAACSSQQQRHIQYLDGIDPVIQGASIKISTENQNSVFQSLYSRAGLSTGPKRNAEEWDDVIRAGMDYVDEECELYVNSIFWAQRATDTTVKNLGLIGAATGTVLGLADASASTFGYVAAAFGLSAALIDSTASGLLYKLEPSVVRSVIENSRSAYRTAVLGNEDGAPELRRKKPGAAAAIRGYLALCLPAGIEKQINNSLSNQEFTVEPGEVPVVRPSGSRGSLSPQVLERLEEATKRIEQFEADQKLKATQRPPSRPNTRGFIEAALTDDELLKIQSALCVKEDAILGPDTRAAIDDWRRSISPDDVLTDVELAKGLSAPESLYLRRTSSCVKLGFKSAFEKGFLHDERTRAGHTKEGVKATGARRLTSIAGKLGVAAPANSNVLDDTMRTKISAKREELRLPKGDWLDYELYFKLYE